MTTLGEKRYESDMRQFGGMLLTLSALITMSSLTGTTAIVAASDTPNSGKPLYDLIASLCLSVVGIVGVIMGYLTLVEDRGWSLFSLGSCFITQLAWLPFISDLVGVGMASQMSLVPEAYTQATPGDNKFLGAMGILSILAYAAAYVGSMSFMQFAIYAFQSGNTKRYSASYYRGRLLYYSSLLCLAGFAQMSAGSYIISKFGNGPLSPPIGAGPLIVSFPGINVFLGILQLLIGSLGVARHFGLTLELVHTYIFSWLCLFLWVAMLSLQILVQIGYPAGGELVAMSPTLGCIYFAIAFAPAYLDYKTTTTPEEIEDGYYMVHGAAEKEDVQVVEDAVEEVEEKADKAEKAV